MDFIISLELGSTKHFNNEIPRLLILFRKKFNMSSVDDAMLALLVVGFIIAFILAFSMGANDVANAFGTSYGSKVLTFYQVVVLASIFETLGAILLGGKVSNTISRGISEIYYFRESVYQLMYGYLSSLVGASGWLLVATVFKLPVSGTHSIVGAVIGFSMVANGPNSIKWITLVKVVSSWFSSPLIAGGLSSVLFVAVKYLVLERPNPLEAGCKFLPVMYGLTISVISFMVTEEANDILKSQLTIWQILLIAVAFGVACWFLTFALVMPLVKHSILEKTNRSVNNPDAAPASKELLSGTQRIMNWLMQKLVLIRDHFASIFGDVQNGDKSRTTTLSGNTNNAMQTDDEQNMSHHVQLEALPCGISTGSQEYSEHPRRRCSVSSREEQNTIPGTPNFLAGHPKKNEYQCDDLEHEMTVDESTQQQECDIAETPEIRILFTFIQVITATFASFSHGANDVSNAVGPIIGMYQVYKNNEIVDNTRPELWILLFGGLSMSIGLFLLGKKVMATIGNDLATISPATGFCMELGTAFTVLFASHVGVPVSTTHCLVGAVVCVSLVKNRQSVDWKLARNIAFSWLVTVPASGLISAGCMAALEAIFKSTKTFQYWSYFHPIYNNSTNKTMEGI